MNNKIHHNNKVGWVGGGVKGQDEGRARNTHPTYLIILFNFIYYSYTFIIRYLKV